MKNIFLAFTVFSIFLLSAFATDSGADQAVHSNDLKQLQGKSSTHQHGGATIKYKWTPITPPKKNTQYIIKI